MTYRKAAVAAQELAVSQRTAAEIELYLRNRVANALKLDIAFIDPSAPVTTYGVDSLAAMEIAHDIEEQLKISVDFDDLLGGASISEIAAHALDGPAHIPERVSNGASGKEPHRLSHGQEALWFLYRLAPDSAAYHISAAMRFRCSLDISVLRRALESIVSRHPSLRTTFSQRAGKPVQQIHDCLDFEWRVENARGWDETNLHAELTRESHRPFDLEHGPLFRVAVFTLSNDDHVVLFALHHIISDFWSQSVMLKELICSYTAELAGKPVLLDEPAHFIDFVKWEHEFLETEAADQHWTYWERQLAGPVPELNLPADRPRPQSQTTHGAEVSHVFDEKLTSDVKRLSRECGVTLYTTLLALYFALLHRYTDESDLVVGSPVMGRVRAEWSGSIGYFVNTLPLRVTLKEGESFRTLLAHVRGTVLGALEHQQIPFSALAQRLQPARTPGRSPWFDSLFVFQKPPSVQGHNLAAFALGVPGVRVDCDGLVLESMPLRHQAAQFDWTLMMGEVGETLAASVKYNSDLFDSATVQRMLGHFAALAAAAVTEPDLPLTQYPLASSSESQRARTDWNGPAKALPAVPCVSRLIELQAERTPFAPALAFGTEQLTYADLNAKANRVAHRLIELGAGRETPIALLVGRGTAMIIGLLAVLKTGGVYVPIDPDDPDARIEGVLAQVQPLVLLTEAELFHRAPDYAGQRICMHEATDGATADSANPDNGVAAQNLAYIIFTSGSTGVPRGVAVERGQLLNYVTAICDRIQFPAHAHFATVSTIAADLGNTMIFPALCSGGCLHVLPREQALDPASFAEYCSDHEIDCLKIVPSHLAALLRHSNAASVLPRRVLILGGEALPWSLAQKVKDLNAECRVINHYGPTETTVGVLTNTYEEHSASTAASTVPIGRPLGNVQTYVLDSALNILPAGVPGELYIGGSCVTRGYYGRAALTAAQFIPDPFGSPGARLYKTGDRARYLSDGTIEFLGRVDRQLKIRGFRIEPDEIEEALSLHPSVSQAVVVPRDGACDSLLACIVRDPENTTTPQELRRFLREKLPEHMVPSAFAWVNALPLNKNGKIDRDAIPLTVEEILTDDTGFVEPTTELERTLAAIWAQLLGVERVGLYDSFFELGGHSLLATEMITQIQDVLPSETPLLTLFFQNPTVAGLADAIIQECTPEEGVDAAALLQALGSAVPV